MTKHIIFIFNVLIVAFLSWFAALFTLPGFIVFDQDFVEIATGVTRTNWMLFSWLVYMISIAFLPITWISDGSKLKNRYVYLTIAACLGVLICVIIGIMPNDYTVKYPPD